MLDDSLIAANYVSRDYSASHPDNAIEVVYLVIALVLLSSVDVRIERGRLSLSGIAIGTGAMLLNPLHVDAGDLGVA